MAKACGANNEIDKKSEEELKGKSAGHSPFYAKRTKHNNVIGPWQPCDLVRRVNNRNENEDRFIIKFAADGTELEVPDYELASGIEPEPNDLKKLGTRVIANRRTADLPYIIDARNGKINLFSNQEHEFYPGIIAREFQDEYCVFFDDGIVQWMARNKIRCVDGKDEYNHAHQNAKEYFELYATKEQFEIIPTEQKTIQVELDGAIKDAKVLKVNRILAQIHFPDANRFEWIYLGSPRILKVYRNLILSKSLDEIIEFRTFKPCRSADVVAIDVFEQQETNNDSADDHSMPSTSSSASTASESHECNNECVREEANAKVNDSDPHVRPIFAGWLQSYRTPCGLYLQSIHEIEAYLAKTQSKLTIGCFDLSKNAIKHIRINDISRGVEKIPVSVCGHEMSMKDRAFNYTLKYNFDFVDVDLNSNLNREGCGCKDNCRNKSKCSCWQLTIKRATKGRRMNESKLANFGYRNKKLIEIIPSGIVECGANCKCCADQCVNRVVGLQHGLQHELEVFMTPNRGWGVRTNVNIPNATFVCTYAGDVLEKSVADKRSTEYQFKLPRADSDEDSDSEGGCSNAEPKPKKRRHTKRYDVIQTFVNYLPPSKDWNANNFPESDVVGPPAEDYVVDALHHGNVSRFLNHSCDPNLFVQHVFVDDDVRFPRIAFFTREAIEAGTELTFDYMYDLIRGHETPCLCGTAKCRKRLT